MTDKPEHDDATAIATREQVVTNRETSILEGEDYISSREELLRLREQALRARAEVDLVRAERERLLVQMQEANERLVIATMQADELREKALAARAAAENEAQFQTLANSIPMLAWYANPDGSVVWYNARWYEYTGATEQAGWHESMHDPADVERVRATWQAAVASGEAWEDVFRLRRHDGELRWFLSRALPVHDTSGQIVRWFGTNVDIEDQKRAEARAVASDRAKDEFLAMLGHELRNPLSPIVANLALIARRDPTAFPRERELIESQVHYLIRLVDDLLDISRITEGKIVLRPEPIELGVAVARAIEMVRPLIESKAHELVVDVPLLGLVVDADPTRLAQIIGNLLTNAAKYTPPGGRIDVLGERRVTNPDAIVSLRIRDTGIGISDEMLPRIFDTFSQEPQALDRAQGGLGLGLAIVRRLVTMHGGTIRAQSAGHGQGSELEMELPASSRTVEPDVARMVDESAVFDGLKVLIVDDNRLSAEAFCELLSTFGCETRVAFDGPSALSMAKAFLPDVALLDIGLPGMDGYELARHLRETLAPHELHFIAITGYGQSTDVARSQSSGFSSHLVKPVDVAILVERLHGIVAPR